MTYTNRSSWTHQSEAPASFSPNSNQPELLERILAFASAQPEGTPLYPEGLEHLGSPVEITEAMSELCSQGHLRQIYQRVYVQPIQTSFGACSPAFEKTIPQLANLWQETIVPTGGAAANVLGMTTQVPVRPVYLTSGCDKALKFGNLTVELRHAPEWQLLAPHHLTGDVLRAMAWLGPGEAQKGLDLILHKVSIEELKELTGSCPETPQWITESLEAASCNA